MCVYVCVSVSVCVPGPFVIVQSLNCCMSTLHLVHNALLLTPACWKSNNTNARLMASALSLALDPTFGIHSHKTLDTAQPCRLLKPNWKPSSSHSISILTNISTQFLLQSLCVCVCACVRACVCARAFLHMCTLPRFPRQFHTGHVQEIKRQQESNTTGQNQHDRPETFHCMVAERPTHMFIALPVHLPAPVGRSSEGMYRNNNNNVHLSCTHQCPEHSHYTH